VVDVLHDESARIEIGRNLQVRLATFGVCQLRSHMRNRPSMYCYGSFSTGRVAVDIRKRGQSPVVTDIRAAFFAILSIALCAAGCGRADMGEVSGVVTLDGKPLPNAFLEFIPTGESGSTSSGRTNDDGKYELMFSRDISGAWLGPHRVRITTRDVTTDEKGREVWLPEKVPPRYNTKTELTCDVKTGSNRFEFHLESARTAESP
jgi:hypothetical protein